MKNIQLQDISVSFGAQVCLDRITLHFPYGERMALCGANGSGKSTLMKIMAGITQADSGKIIATREARVAYLPQGNVVCGPDTLIGEATKAFRIQDEWQMQTQCLEDEISTLSPESPRLAGLLHRHHELRERLSRSGYFSRERSIFRVLTGLGFTPEEFEKPAASFSLGWQMRLALAKTLLQDPDFLLLDEPTNYLDLEARIWLLDFIKKFPGGILVVSHDRFFLDNTVNAVAELFTGTLKLYQGNYTSYEQVRAQEMATLIEKALQVDEERERLETFIRRFRAQASKASQVQSRIKQLAKLPVIEIPSSVKKMHFQFPEPPASGKLLLAVDGLSKSYDGNIVFRDVLFNVERGEKVALVGPNGAGKSTLLRVLAGREKHDGGHIRYDDRSAIGFFTVDETPQVEEDQTVLEVMEGIIPDTLYPRVRSLLGAFLFRGDDVFKRIRVLSGGERCRLLLLTLLVKPRNVLILDEPTSHLDIASQDVLLEALKRFSGTVLFVSHDRQFIEGLAGKVIELDDRRANVYNGDYHYFLWKKEQARMRDVQERTKHKESQTIVSEGRTKHEKSKAVRNALKKIDRDEAVLLARLDGLKQECGELEALLATEEVYRNGEQVRSIKGKLAAHVAEEKRLFDRWQGLERERDRLESDQAGAR